MASPEMANFRQNNERLQTIWQHNVLFKVFHIYSVKKKRNLKMNVDVFFQAFPPIHRGLGHYFTNFTKNCPFEILFPNR